MKKVVYFDEGSVTDYLQIVRKGNMTNTTSLLKEIDKEKSGEAGLEGAFNPFASLLTAITGFSTKISAKGNISASSRTDKMAKTIIQNTVLSDFLEMINDKETQQNDIVRFTGYELSEPIGSLTEFLKISVYTNMMNGSTPLNTSDNLELNVNKFDETIKMAKGYFEFIGINKNAETHKIVFRFNLDALRNNYRSTDLTKMDLEIYAIRVGKVSKKDINFVEEMKPISKKSNPSKLVPGEKASSEKAMHEERFDLYDVLCAGVA